MVRRRLKRRSRRYILVSFLSIVLICLIFFSVSYVIINQIREKYKIDLSALKDQMAAKEVYIFEAKVDIPAGSLLKEEDLYYSLSYSGKPQSYFMTKEDIGMFAAIDIKAGTQIISSMLLKDATYHNLREVEYNTFYISSNIGQNDYVDVRIRFPNGEDYIILSKKRILSPNVESFDCFLWLDEEEILYMSSAIVDAYIYQGSILYTTKYIEPNLQEASLPTYEPSLATLALMEQDKNIVERASVEVNKRLRKAMENRLSDYLNLDPYKIRWNINTKEDDRYHNWIKDSENNGDLSSEQREYDDIKTYEVQEDDEIIYEG